MTPPFLSLYGILYHISNVYNIFDMTPPLFSLYGILYHILNVYYTFDMNPHTRYLTHVVCIPMLRSRMTNQPCRYVYKEMRLLKTKC